MQAETKLVLLAAIAGAHGVRGQVKIKSFTADPAALTDYGRLLLKDGSPAPKLKLEGTAKELLIARVDGIADRNQAEQSRGLEFYIRREQLPDTEDEDEFYLEDLKGLTVFTLAGESVGVVSSVMNFGAGDIVDIRFKDGKENSFSFNKATFPSVDIAAGTILFDAPEELEAREQGE